MAVLSSNCNVVRSPSVGMNLSPAKYKVATDGIASSSCVGSMNLTEDFFPFSSLSPSLLSSLDLMSYLSTKRTEGFFKALRIGRFLVIEKKM